MLLTAENIPPQKKSVTVSTFMHSLWCGIVLKLPTYNYIVDHRHYALSPATLCQGVRTSREQTRQSTPRWPRTIHCQGCVGAGGPQSCHSPTTAGDAEWGVHQPVQEDHHLYISHHSSWPAVQLHLEGYDRRAPAESPFPLHTVAQHCIQEWPQKYSKSSKHPLPRNMLCCCCPAEGEKSWDVWAPVVSFAPHVFLSCWKAGIE